MADPSALIEVGCACGGAIVRVTGRGTLHESSTVHQFALQSLASSASDFFLDLSACEYLDSTFLGCLVDIHKRFNRGAKPRFAIVSVSPACKKILGACHLDKFLSVTEDPPKATPEWVTLSCPTPESTELGFHVMECHRRLAELGGPMGQVFGQIADQLERELRSRESSQSRNTVP